MLWRVVSFERHRFIIATIRKDKSKPDLRFRIYRWSKVSHYVCTKRPNIVKRSGVLIKYENTNDIYDSTKKFWHRKSMAIIHQSMDVSWYNSQASPIDGHAIFSWKDKNKKETSLELHRCRLSVYQVFGCFLRFCRKTSISLEWNPHNIRLGLILRRCALG